MVRRFGPALHRRGFECVSLQTDWVRERLDLSPDELMLEMRVLDSSGKVVGRAAGVLFLARTFWWALPLVWLARIPGVFGLMDPAYRLDGIAVTGGARRGRECRVMRTRLTRVPVPKRGDTIQSGRGLPHSRTLREVRQVLESVRVAFAQ